MAYVSQDMKKEKLAKIKPVLKKFGLKGTLAVRNHSTLCLTISEGGIDFIGNSNETCAKDFYQVSRGFKPTNETYSDVNVYHYKSHYSGKALKALNELIGVLYEGHWDESDIQTDYFHCAYYVNVSIGKWNKPYKVSA